MGENLYMQNATWLVSRELVEAAGPWNTHLNYDQDGEYFARCDFLLDWYALRTRNWCLL